MNKTWTRSLLALVVTGVLGCSSAAEQGSAGASAEPLRTFGGVVGSSCSASSPCAAGSYCAPAPSSPACGAGTCTADPMTCPLFETLGVCGCDAKPYMNESCANVHGTSSEGPRAIAGAQIPDVAGTWARVVSKDDTLHTEVDETLDVASDGTYSLTQTSRCLASPGIKCFHAIRVLGESSGTLTVGSNGGFLFDGTCAVGDCSSLADEFRLERDCANYTGALHVSVIEPPGASEAANTYYLAKAN